MNTCCHCKRCERVESGSLVVGKLDGRPYRGYLCEEHRQALIDDGLVVREPRILSDRKHPLDNDSIRAQRARLDALFAGLNK